MKIHGNSKLKFLWALILYVVIGFAFYGSSVALDLKLDDINFNHKRELIKSFIFAIPVVIVPLIYGWWLKRKE